jgi:hypothetical protein
MLPRTGGPAYELDQRPIGVSNEGQENIPILEFEDTLRPERAESGEEAFSIRQAEDQRVLNFAPRSEGSVNWGPRGELKQFQELTTPLVSQPNDLGPVIHSPFGDGSQTQGAIESSSSIQIADTDIGTDEAGIGVGHPSPFRSRGPTGPGGIAHRAHDRDTP